MRSSLLTRSGHSLHRPEVGKLIKERAAILILRFHDIKTLAHRGVKILERISRSLKQRTIVSK
jgi:hypothetical protein